MKDLPRVFANPINKAINNNGTYNYGKLEERSKEQDLKKVREKLDSLFKSPNNIYSIDCIITYKDHEENILS